VTKLRTGIGKARTGEPPRVAPGAIGGSLYEIADNLAVCVYRPEPDMHIPLAMAGDAPGSIAGWTILSGRGSEPPGYILIIDGRAGDVLAVETHVGVRHVNILRRSPFAALPSALRGPVATALARVLADDESRLASIGPILGPMLGSVRAGDAGGWRRDGGDALLLDLAMLPRKVLAATGDGLAVLTVAEAAIEAGDGAPVRIVLPGLDAALGGTAEAVLLIAADGGMFRASPPASAAP
jgi:hypothetical protein